MIKHSVNCHPGSLRYLFLEGTKEERCLEKQHPINTVPMNKDSCRNSEDCQKNVIDMCPGE